MACGVLVELRESAIEFPSDFVFFLLTSLFHFLNMSTIYLHSRLARNVGVANCHI